MQNISKYQYINRHQGQPGLMKFKNKIILPRFYLFLFHFLHISWVLYMFEGSVKT